MSKNVPTKVITGIDTRWSYCHIFEPVAISEGSPKKYSVSLLIPETDQVTLNKIRAAIRAAYEEGAAKLKGNSKTLPPLESLKTPLRHGSERPDDPAYQGCWFINASSNSAPGLVDADLNPILDKSLIFSGVYGRASINFYAYNTGTARGVAAGLANLQYLRPGEPLGGRASAEADFSLDDDGDDDFLS